MNNRLRSILPPLLLFLATFALFAPSIGYSLVNLDDPVFIAANPIVFNGFSWASLGRAFTALHGDCAMYSPLVWVSFLFDNLFFHASVASPWGFHFTNVLLHAISSAILYFILRRCTRGTLPALLAAAFWALHPLRVESVAWVTERKDTLSTLFAFLSILFYLKSFHAPSSRGLPATAPQPPPASPQAPSPRGLPAAGRVGETSNPSPTPLFPTLSFLFFAAGLLTKPMLVTLPFLLLLLDYWPLRRFSLRGAFRTLPRLALGKWHWFLLAALVSVITRHLQTGAVVDAPLPVRLASLPQNYFFYLAKSFWPSNLVPLALGFPSTPLVLWGAAALFLGLGILSFATFRRCPGIAIGLAAFAGLLFPVSGIVFIGSVPVADRYTYLPALGLSLALAALLDACRPLRHAQLRILHCAFCIPLATLAAVTLHILPTWKDTRSFPDRIARIFPGHYYAVADRFKTAFVDDGDPATALPFARRILADRPGSTYGINAMVLILSQLDSSRAALDFAAANPPTDKDKSSEELLDLDLAVLHADVGDFDAALARLDRILANRFRSPKNTGLVQSLAFWVCAEAGHRDRARRFAAQIPSFDPADPFAPANFLLPHSTAWNLGFRRQTLPRLLRLAQDCPDNPSLLNNVAWILATSPNSPAAPADAVAIARRALDLAPGNPVLRDTLAVTLAFAGSFDEAAALESAVAADLRSDPSSPVASILPAVENRLALFESHRPFTEDSSSRLLYAP